MKIDRNYHNKIVTCSNYGCYYNSSGACSRKMISLGADGKCIFETKDEPSSLKKSSARLSYMNDSY